jgi:enediyne polyketide synthase
MPDERMPLAGYHDADRSVPDKTYGTMAAVLDGYAFDWAKRRIPKAAYEATDVAHWLALDVALQMLDDAGYTPERLPRTTTQVVIGNSLTGEFTRSNTLRLRWPYIARALEASTQRAGLSAAQRAQLANDLETEFKSAFPPVNEDSLAGGLANTIAGRICNYLNLHGGGYTVDGACASSLIAIYTGASSLANGSADFVIAGGVDVSLDPFELVGFAKAGALTATEMAVYDERGNGFIPGEGCGVVGMKRLADARRDGDKVYAVLDGWGVSSDGKGGITAPSAHGQSLALQRAYASAGIDPGRLDFIEGHGTGTAVGDKTELLGIAKAFSAHTPTARSCGMTSLKSVIGHTKAAAGVGAFIKAVIAVNQRVLPPTAGCTRPHAVFSGEGSSLYPLQRGAVVEPTRELRAGVSAMGFGGINVHVTLASADPATTALRPTVDNRAALASLQDCEVFCLSASSERTLRERIRTLREAAHGASLAELADLAATINSQVDPVHGMRASIVARSPKELSEKLDHLESMVADGVPSHGLVTDPARLIAVQQGTQGSRLGFLFPGQGSHQLNMARPLVERFDWARRLVADADRWAAELGTHGLADALYPQSDRLIGPAELELATERLRDTRCAQPAIVLASLIWLEYLKQLGITPGALLGHSLGELTAFFAAGAFDEKTLLQLAVVRGQLMAGDGSEGGGTMLSLACNQEQAERAIREVDAAGVLVVANLNSKKQTVVSGDRRSIAALREWTERSGLRSQPLRVSNAFHSPLVAEAAKGIRAWEAIPGVPERIGVRLISSCDGAVVAPDLRLREHFAQQIISPVNFVRAAEVLRSEADWTIEVGPGRTLTSLIEQDGPHAGWTGVCVEASAESFRDLNWVVALAHVQGTSLRWHNLYANRVLRPFKSSSELTFLVNPCETVALATRSLAEPAPTTARPAPTVPPDRQPVVARSTNAFAVLADLTAKLTGFDRASIHADLSPLDDLNMDSIKVGSLIADTCLQLGVEVPDDPAALSTLTLGTIGQRLMNGTSAAGRKGGYPDHHGILIQPDPTFTSLAAHAEKPVSGVAVLARSSEPDTQAQWIVKAEQTLLELARRHTGFDTGSFDARSSLTDDLNLDSIKVAALMAEAESSLNVSPGFDSDAVSGASIGEIARRLSERRTTTTASVATLSMPVPVMPAPLPAESPHVIQSDPEVKTFAMRLRPAPLERSESWPYSGQRIAIQCEPDEQPFAQALARRLDLRGANVVTLNARALLDIPREDFDQIIVIMPRVSSTSNAAVLVQTNVQLLRAAAVCSARQRKCESITYVQFGGLDTAADATHTSFSMACASAFAASVHLERPELRVRVVDLWPGHNPGRAAQCVMDEHRGTSPYVLCHYSSDQQRHEQEAVTLRPELAQPRAIHWSKRDVVLVTGGAKGITAECAFAFARATGVRMILVGSSPRPDASDATSEVTRTLDRFAADGLFARYYACDIVDPAAMAKLVEHVRREYGEISGVIHGAAVNRPRRADQVDEATAVKKVSPKLTGLLNLCDVLRAKPPKLFVVMSSIIGVTGMQGNAWYAFSNEAASACLARFRVFHPETQVVSLAYSAWSEVGMAARMGSDKHLARIGVSSLPPATGVARFLDATMRDPGTMQVVIAGALGGLDTWPAPKQTCDLSGRFLENVLTSTPGVEVVARSRLTLEEDLYLSDHLYRGLYLFPTVFGLEAMAQVVAKLVGVNEFKALKLIDVKLERPILVPKEGGAEIQVHARTLPYEAGQAPHVHVGISVEQSAFKRDHFSATFVLEAPQPPPSSAMESDMQTPLALEPKRELYGSMLFQGEMFQVLEKVWKLDGRGSLTSARHARRPHYFSPKHPQNLILGDPLLRDGVLQSAQLSESATVLPIGIEAVHLYDLKRPEEASANIWCEVTARSAVGPTCSTMVRSPSGKPIERLVGYHLKQMDPHDERAAAPSDWVDPTERDTRILREVVAKHCAQLALMEPQASITFVPRLDAMKRSERHIVEAPLLLEFARASIDGPHPEIGWTAGGKPQLLGIPLDDQDVSLSHDGNHCLCVSGPGAQGCDLQSVEPRSRAEWTRLLGPENEPLLEQLLASGELLDVAGTRLWSASEAVFKSSGTRALASVQRADDAVLFTPKHGNDGERVLTVALSLTRPPQRVVALVLRSTHRQEQLATQAADFPEIRHRFHSTFKDTVGAVNGVKPAIFADWMGSLRELSVAGIARELIADFATGRWGMVTNYSNVQILERIRCLDELEGRLRFVRAYGSYDSCTDLHFEWTRSRPDGTRELMARADMATTWVEILGHGLVAARPFPDYLDRLVQSYLPSKSVRELTLPTQVVPETSLLGPALYTAPNAPRIRPELARYTFATSSQESNFVGNIYYANYYRWQSEAVERFMRELEASTDAPARGTLACTFCSIAHLREAMPYDDIEVSLALRGLYRHGVELHFEFYKRAANGQSVKLATGRYQAVWIGASGETAGSLPQHYVSGFERFVSEAAE